MSDPIRLIQTVHLIQPLQPLTAHKQQKYNFTLQNISAPAWKHPAFPKKFQIPVSLSLSPPKSLSQFCPKPLSLSHPPTTLANGPTSSESSKLSGTLSFSLYPSLPHSFSHLTSLISQVLLLREMMPFFLIFEVTIRPYFYQHNPMDWYFLVRFSSPLFSGS